MKRIKRIDKRFFLAICMLGMICASCTDYTPKPRGYMRIEPGVAQYALFKTEEFPFTFSVSELANVELPPEEGKGRWMNIVYPSLEAKIYCSYLPITPAKLEEVEEEVRLLILRQTKEVTEIKEQAYEDPGLKVYATFFQLEGESASPYQFVVTDSTRHFFRGALYFDSKLNTDSLAPVISYLKEDIVELIQSFHWRN